MCNNVFFQSYLNLSMAIVRTTWIKFSNLRQKVNISLKNNFLKLRNQSNELPCKSIE